MQTQSDLEQKSKVSRRSLIVQKQRLRRRQIAAHWLTIIVRGRFICCADPLLPLLAGNANCVPGRVFDHTSGGSAGNQTTTVRAHYILLCVVVVDQTKADESCDRHPDGVPQGRGEVQGPDERTGERSVAGLCAARV